MVATDIGKIEDVALLRQALCAAAYRGDEETYQKVLQKLEEIRDLCDVSEVVLQKQDSKTSKWRLFDETCYYSDEAVVNYVIDHNLQQDPVVFEYIIFSMNTNRNFLAIELAKLSKINNYSLLRYATNSDNNVLAKYACRTFPEKSDDKYRMLRWLDLRGSYILPPAETEMLTQKIINSE